MRRRTSGRHCWARCAASSPRSKHSKLRRGRRVTLLTKSQPVELLGEAPPRVLVTPQGVRSNSAVDVVDLSASFGLTLDGWQELILETAMGERSDATWAAKRVGITVPRQNGKSQLLVARALAGALLFGEKKIVISAHQQDTAREAFGKLMEIIEADGNAALRSRLDPRFGRGGVMNALNREAVRFTTGATIQFKARSGAAGKGFSSDCLLLDEAQILGSRAWTSINSTMSAMPNPQVWLLGTPPQEEDDCFAFDMVRRSALAGVSTAAAWCEWGADVNAPDYDPASEFTRWSANPAWNVRINHEVVQGEFETYTPDRFAQDRLGIWRDDVGASRLIPASDWEQAHVTNAPVGVRSLGVVFDFETDRGALAGAVKHDDGVHVELIDVGPVNIDALADWIEARWRSLGMIALAGGAGAKALKQSLRDCGVPERVIRVMSTPEYFAGNAMLVDGITQSRTVTVPAGEATDALELSVKVSDKKAGTSGWRWIATTPDGDRLPMEAISVALWAARTNKRRPGRTVKVG